MDLSIGRCREFSAGSQLGAARSRIVRNFLFAWCYRSPRQDVNHPARTAGALGHPRRALTSTGKLQERSLDDAIFKRVKTDNCKAPFWL
jgi:hypothetical protein